MVLPLADEADAQPLSKKYPLCVKCKTPLDGRVPRGSFVKKFLFWLPIKRYVCFTCNRKRYVFGQ
jgi:hypothetical protein